MSNDIISLAEPETTVGHQEGDWEARMPFLSLDASLVVSPEELAKGHARIARVRGEDKIVLFETSFREFSLIIGGQELRMKIVEPPPPAPPFTYPMTDLPGQD